MTSTPSVPQPERLIPELDSFRAIARRHALQTGSPECVIPLPFRLSQDRSLRANITELLRELQQTDPDFSLPDALWLLLTAIGGSEGTTQNPAIDEAVDLTSSFLVSIGGWASAPIEPITDIDHPSAHDPRLAPQQDTGTAPLTEHPSPIAESTPAVPDAEATPPPSASPDRLVLTEITRALTRLEQSTVSLRLHLDSIDQRLSRMEPLLESSPALEPPSHRSDRGAVEQTAPQAGPRDLVHRHDPAPSIPPSPQAAAPTATSSTPGLRRDRFTAAMDLPGTRSTLYIDPLPEAQPRSAPESASPHAPFQENAQSSRRADPAQSAATHDSTTAPQSPAVVLSSVSALVSASEQAQSAELGPEQSVKFPRGNGNLFSTRPSPPTGAAARSSSPEISRGSSPSESLNAAFPPQPEHAAGGRLSGSPVASAIVPAQSLDPRLESITPQEDQLSHRGTLPQLQFGNEEQEDPDGPEHSLAGLDDSKPRSNIGAHILGIISALVVALALWLLFQDKPFHLRPSFIPSSGTPSKSTAPSPSSAKPAAGNAPSTPSQSPPDDAQPATPPAEEPPASTAPSSSAEPSGTNRVLGARESSQPRASEQVFTTPTFVPERVMKARLVSAAPPLYPQVVNSPRLHGDVVFEAIIGKDGTVDGLTPLGGEHVLRDAAANAVRVWRFQPYTVHGHPVEVRTILHVHVEPDRTTPR